jgi:chemotaxis protein MotA
MFVVIGALVVLGSIIAGYTMHGGQLLILFQVTEIIIIGGAALGSLLISNPMSVTKRLFKGVIAVLKGSKLSRDSYEQLLRALYDLSGLSRREGIIALEKHVEQPAQSPIFQAAPKLLANHHAMSFLCDTLRTIVSGVNDPHELEELMDKDIETAHAEELAAPQALSNLSDSLPGLGIVAAVLGVVITMGQIDQPPVVIGHSVAAALVGTFLGILLCYGFVGPMARNLDQMISADGRYLGVIKAGVLSLARGASPQITVEYARRAIGPDDRPSFEAVEKMMKKAA